MSDQLRLFIRHVIVLAVMAFAAPTFGNAEQPPQTGKRSGVYEIDRWNRHVLNNAQRSMPLDSTLAKKLAPYLRKPIELNVTTFGTDEYDFPGYDLSISGFDVLNVVSNPMLLDIKWVDTQGHVVQGALKQINERRPCSVSITLVDESTGLGFEQKTVFLGIRRRYPSCTGAADQLGYFSRGIYIVECPLLPQSQIIRAFRTTNAGLVQHSGVRRDFRDFFEVVPDPKPSGTSGHVPKNRKRDSWQLTLKNWPPNEYEVFVFHKTKQPEMIFISNVLRLDVLTNESSPWQGLDVDLQLTSKRERGALDTIPMEIHFRNIGSQPLLFRFEWTACHRIKSLSGSSCATTKSSTLPWPKVREGLADLKEVRLAPGKEHVIPVNLPKATTLAA